MLRTGLWLLTALETAQAAVMLFAPSWFFAFSWVNLGMPYNAHLLADFGAANLALAFVLGDAAVRGERRRARTALLAFIVLAVPHLIIHARFAGSLPPAQSALLLTALAVVAVIPAAMLPLTRQETDSTPHA